MQFATPWRALRHCAGFVALHPLAPHLLWLPALRSPSIPNAPQSAAIRLKRIVSLRKTAHPATPPKVSNDVKPVQNSVKPVEKVALLRLSAAGKATGKTSRPHRRRQEMSDGIYQRQSTACSCQGRLGSQQGRGVPARFEACTQSPCSFPHPAGQSRGVHQLLARSNTHAASLKFHASQGRGCGIGSRLHFPAPHSLHHAPRPHPWSVAKPPPED
jgi:hypothetical protein